MIKYKAHYGTIGRREVDKESTSCVWIKGRKWNKNTTSYSFTDSLEEAKAWVVANEEREIENCEREISSWRRRIAQSKNKIDQVRRMIEVVQPDGSVVITRSDDA